MTPIGWLRLGRHMSISSCDSLDRSVIMFAATSAAELAEVLLQLQPSLTYPLLVSILQETALIERSESSLESDSGSVSTTSPLH